MGWDSAILFVCSLSLEIGWVLSVRLVQMNSTSLIFTAMLMQLISYVSTVSVVHDPNTMFAGIVGAGLGAGLGLMIPVRR